MASPTEWGGYVSVGLLAAEQLLLSTVMHSTGQRHVDTPICIGVDSCCGLVALFSSVKAGIKADRLYCNFHLQLCRCVMRT